jgi:hypothetical protein
MELQAVYLTDRVKPVPGLAERETEVLVVRDGAHKIVDRELGAKDVTRGFGGRERFIATHSKRSRAR